MKANRSSILIVLLVAVAGIAGYLAYGDYLLRQSRSDLENKMSQTVKDFVDTNNALNSRIKDLDVEIVSTKEALATTTAMMLDCGNRYSLQQNTITDLGSQVNAARSQLGTLEKLSQTDPELLKKYSKVFFLSENYVPASLAKIDPNYAYNPKTDFLFYTETLPFLNLLMSTAQMDKIDIKVISAYRSFGEQSGLKSSYKVTYGSGANKFSADQGYSEHQMGTAVDFTTSTVGDTFNGFEKTPAYQWLIDNAYNFGFVMSYPKGNSYYQYEPWHWRFVGRALAQKLREEGKSFYDLDQREIDQYLISFFD